MTKISLIASVQSIHLNLSRDLANGKYQFFKNLEVLYVLTKLFFIFEFPSLTPPFTTLNQSEKFTSQLVVYYILQLRSPIKKTRTTVFFYFFFFSIWLNCRRLTSPFLQLQTLCKLMFCQHLVLTTNFPYKAWVDPGKCSFNCQDK